MPLLKNDYDNNPFTRISLEINLIKNRMFDFFHGRADYLNWIPFELKFIVGDSETYNYSQEYGATFSCEELKYFFRGIDDLIEQIKARDATDEVALEETRCFKYYTLEAYFGMDFSDAFDNLIEITLWINMGSLTNGKDSGYERGFKFITTLNDVVKFKNELEEQLKSIIH